MTKRIYIVHDVTTDETTYVEAATQAQAISLLARKRYEVRVANTLDLFEGVRSGVKIITEVWPDASKEKRGE